MHWTKKPYSKKKVAAAISKGWETRRKKAAEKTAKKEKYPITWSKKQEPESTVIQAKPGSTITITISVS